MCLTTSLPEGRLFVSDRLRQRGVCQQCGESCRVAPVEAFFVGLRNQHRVLEWSSRSLCPPCRVAVRDFWFPPGRRDRAGSIGSMADAATKAPVGVTETHAAAAVTVLDL